VTEGGRSFEGGCGGSQVRTVIILVPVTARCGRHPRACLLLEVARHCQGHDGVRDSSELEQRGSGRREAEAGGGRHRRPEMTGYLGLGYVL
jgi:hypothetical protein